MTGVPSPLEAHALLSEQDFVRRLARSLVFDQDRVDDAVQDAWLAAVQRPPRHRGAAAGWFRRVLHNVARRRARDEARRRAREAAAARPEALPSAADVVLREQQRRLVVDAVLALPEPYRGTVLARFFDDLEPSEIAARRTVPAATVRSQLQRGLEMLRERLDREHGDRRQWCLTLLPLARPARAAGAGTSIAGALLMGKMLAGVGVAALAVLGALWLSGRDPLPQAATGERASTVAAAGGDASARVPAVERVPVSPIAATSATTGAELGLAGLRGRLVFADGRPAPGRLVRVLGIDGIALFADVPESGGERTLPLVRGQATSAADGTFVLAGLLPRSHYLLNADADGADRTLRAVDVTPFPGDVADLGDVVLTNKGRVVGRAVDDNGEAVAGAEVLVLDLPAALAALLPIDRFVPERGGMLTLPVPEAGVTDANYGSRLHDYLGQDLFERADLDREPGLGTFVIDRLAWMEAIWRELPIPRATTAADGSFTLLGVEPGNNVLLARKPGLASGQLPRVVVKAGENKDVGDVRLPAGEELRGTVRDAESRAVAGAEVRVAAIGTLGYRGVAFAEAPVRTDEQGTFVCRGLPRGRAFVAVRSKASVPWSVVGPVDVDDDVVVSLPAMSPLRLQIVRTDGQALTDVDVELFAGPPLHELRWFGVQQQLGKARPVVDADGLCDVGALPPGCYTLRVGARTVSTVTTLAVLPQEEPLRVELTATTELAVRVRDMAGAPIVGAKVHLPRGEDMRLPSSFGLARWGFPMAIAGTTDAAGTTSVQTNENQVYVTHPRYGPVLAYVQQSDRAIEVAMEANGSIDGRLYDHGAPADPRRWRVVARPDTSYGMPLPDLGVTLRTDGTFRFPSLAPSRYQLHAEPVAEAPLTLHGLVLGLYALANRGRRFDSIADHDVKVESAGIARLSFDVDPNRVAADVMPARLSGRACEDDRPLSGLVLERNVHGNLVAIARVGADGTFAADGLLPGRIELSLQDASLHVYWSDVLELEPGVERVLDLTWRTGRVEGTVTFPPDRAKESREVVATRHNGHYVRRSAPVEAAGHFAFALPAGDYKFTALAAECTCEPVAAAIVAGVTSPPIRLELKEALRVQGRVVLGNRVPRKVMVGVRSETMWRMQEPGSDLAFTFTGLEAGTYSVVLEVDGRDVTPIPATIDLTNGPVRDLIVRIADEPKPKK